MTFLQLINQVLTRLRENTIDQQRFQSDPFYRMIGANVNDAKLAVEDMWQWSQNRFKEEIQIISGQSIVELPNSYDNNYLIYSILMKENGGYVRFAPTDWLYAKYRNNLSEPVAPNTPAYWTWAIDNPDTGNQQIELWPPTADYYKLEVYGYRRAPELVDTDDRIKVPSLPVYSLATALSSRERGEVMGATTSELMALASNHASDAIAYDSAKFPEEMDWWSQDRLTETNVKGY